MAHNNPTSDSVLLIDDNLGMLRAFTTVIRNEGFDVHAVQTYDEAVRAFSGSSKPRYILVDQVLAGGPDSGIDAVRRLTVEMPESFLIVYTGDPSPDSAKRWQAIDAGAHRYIRKGSSDELLRDFQQVVQETRELDSLAAQVRDMSRSRNRMLSAIAGAHAHLAIVDREHRVWFSSTASGSGSPLCWQLFHGHPPAWGPCNSCAVSSCVETATTSYKILFNQTPGGPFEWGRMETSPILKDGTNQTLAVRQSYVQLSGVPMELSVEERLERIGQAAVRFGFGRCRIYRLEEDFLRCIHCTVASANPDRERQITAAEDYRTPTSNLYVISALAKGSAVAYATWDEELGPDADAAIHIELRPPFVDVPLLDSKQGLVGWVSMDLNGGRLTSIDNNCLDAASQIGAEVLTALMLPNRQQAPGFDVELAAIKNAINTAGTFESAAGAVVKLTVAMVNQIVPCRDVRMRVLDGNKLALAASLREPEPDRLERDIQDPHSLAGTVARAQKPLFIADWEKYVQNTASRGGPAGLVPKDPGAYAVVPLVVAGVCTGTLSIDADGPLDWRRSGIASSLAEIATLAGLLAHDIAVGKVLERARLAARRESQLLFGIVHGVTGPCSNIRNAFEILRRSAAIDGHEDAAVLEDGLASILTLEKLALQMKSLNPRIRARVEPTQMHVGELLGRIAEASHSNVTINVEQSDALSASVRILDVERVVSACSDLAVNSRKAGANTLTISAQLVDDECIVDFADNGQGFEGVDLGRLFEPGYTGFDDGSGLGLAVIQAAMVENAGRVTAKKGITGAIIRLAWPKPAERP